MPYLKASHDLKDLNIQVPDQIAHPVDNDSFTDILLTSFKTIFNRGTKLTSDHYLN